MLDRESTFAYPETVQLLKSKFIPVAIDQAYQRRQNDAEGEFYREIAGQSPRNNFKGTTQGFFAASASGKLYFYNNNRDEKKLTRLLKQALEAHVPERNVAAIKRGKLEARYNPVPPEGGLVLRVHARIPGGYEPTENRWKKIFQSAVSRDNFWITGEEHQALAQGRLPEKLQRRMVRFHFVDNTRGEPPMWKDDEIKEIDLEFDGKVISGTVRLKTKDGTRGYDAKVRGEIETRDGKITSFDLVAHGRFWGDGPYTKNPPEGKFPLAVSMTLADGTDVADRIPPQGSRGWVPGYLELR